MRLVFKMTVSLRYRSCELFGFRLSRDMLVLIVKMAFCWNSRSWEIPISLIKCKGTLNIEVVEDNRENRLDQWFLGKARERIP